MKRLLFIALFLAASSAHALCGFTAFKGAGVNQASLVPYNYTVVTWPLVKDDTCHMLNIGTAKATPPAGTVIIQAQLWIVGLADDHGPPYYPLYVAKAGKNGLALPFENTATGICTFAIYPNTAVCTIGWRDTSSGSDVYEVDIYVTGAISYIDGNPAHTFWSMTVIQ